jgi:hypothetical protein
MRSASSSNGRPIRASTFHSIGPVHHSSQRLPRRAAIELSRRIVTVLMSAFGGKADIQTSDFDLDQIQGRRDRTIVNNGLAFCETGAS